VACVTGGLERISQSFEKARRWAAYPTPARALAMTLLNRRSGTSTTPAANGYSVLDAQLTVTGDLATAGSLRLDGRMEGTVRQADTVVLGVGAAMTGDVHAREVIVGGTLTGNVFASERVELQATAIVTGDVTTVSVLVQEGGVVNGRVIMRPPEGRASAPDEASAQGKRSTR
jgi:cytoskeletal protein CcmA (bactofilin family)